MIISNQLISPVEVFNSSTSSIALQPTSADANASSQSNSLICTQMNPNEIIINLILPKNDRDLFNMTAENSLPEFLLPPFDSLSDVNSNQLLVSSPFISERDLLSHSASSASFQSTSSMEDYFSMIGQQLIMMVVVKIILM